MPNAVPKSAPQPAPNSLAKVPPPDLFQCSRYFVYRGRVLQCDSNLNRDGENLRPILQDTPAAIAELDTYQSNRRNLQKAAYTGTLGLAVVIGSSLITTLFSDVDTDSGKRLNSYLRVGGGLLTIGSGIYGLAVLRTNERHLENAVHLHNQAQPDNPIQLKFTAEF